MRERGDWHWSDRGVQELFSSGSLNRRRRGRSSNASDMFSKIKKDQNPNSFILNRTKL